ncbi:ADP-ribose glycohydrolase OARD1-like [Diabrotica undecimpunctata]|uniref:ADP-ribose glycohydrolase OARD1-like n=1 Tax=Diabrotica undecimpunctata TaxID=50387 RepID=UPI003B63BCD6
MTVHHNRLAPFKEDHDVDEKVEIQEVPNLTSVNQDLLALPDNYSMIHIISARIKCQLPATGKALKVQDASRYFVYLVTKDIAHNQPNYQDLWEILHMHESNVQKLSMPKLECRQLEWRVARNMV